MLIGFWLFVIVFHIILLIVSHSKKEKRPWISTVSHSVMFVYTIYFLSIFSDEGLVGFLFFLPFFAPFFLPILIWWLYLIGYLIRRLFSKLKEDHLRKGNESTASSSSRKDRILEMVLKHKYITTIVMIVILGGIFIMGISVQQRNSVEAGLASFFNLHPTEDLNELFDALSEIDPSNTWIIHTNVWHTFNNREGRSGSETERIELWMNPESKEVFGEYVIDVSRHTEERTEERRISAEEGTRLSPLRDDHVEERITHTYPVVLTADGIRVPDGIEIADDMRERIENFRLVVQLIDLSEENRGAMDVESAAQSTNQMTTGIPSFHIGYNLDDAHPILLTMREQFNIPAEYIFSRSHIKGNLVFEGGALEPWHLTPGSNDNTRKFELEFISPEAERERTVITSFMRVSRNERTRRTEAEVIHERLADPEIEEVETTEENELSLND